MRGTDATVDLKPWSDLLQLPKGRQLLCENGKQ